MLSWGSAEDAMPYVSGPAYAVVWSLERALRVVASCCCGAQCCCNRTPVHSHAVDLTPLSGCS